MNNIKKILTDAEWAEYQALKAKSQESKPAANADMVAELEWTITRDYGVQPDDDATEVNEFWTKRIRAIISKYRPVKAPTAEGLVTELERLYFHHPDYKTVEKFAREMYLIMCHKASDKGVK